MDGSTASLIAIPIVTTLALAAWLLLSLTLPGARVAAVRQAKDIWSPT